jgi:hypothetical protein
MYSVTDFLDVKRKEITDRLKELKPLAEEYERLKAAASALAKVDGATPAATTTATAAAPRRRGRGRPPGSGTGKKGPGRPRGSGKRGGKAVGASTPAVGATASAEAVAADATPAVAAPKKPGRPKGKGKKVGRPAGSGKKVGRPAGTGKKAGRPKGKVGRRKGSGTRALQALSFVQGQPGITIPELAAKMGIKQNYLYRVLPGLEQEGKLEKKGRGWHPKG